MAEDVSRGRRHGLGDRSSPAVFFFAERRGRVASRAHGRAGAGGLLGPAGSYGEEPKALGGMRGLLNHAIPAVEVGKCCPPVVRCGLLAKRLTQSWLRSRWRTLGRSREKWIGRSGTGEQFRLTCEGPVGSQSRRALPSRDDSPPTSEPAAILWRATVRRRGRRLRGGEDRPSPVSRNHRSRRTGRRPRRPPESHGCRTVSGRASTR